MRRRRTTALLMGLTAFALVAASAATLGGLRVENLGADAEVVAACTTTGLDVSFQTGFANGESTVTGVVLTALDNACDTATATVVLSDAGDIQLGDTGTGDFVGDSVTVAITGDPSAELVEGIAVSVVGSAPATP